MADRIIHGDAMCDPTIGQRALLLQAQEERAAMMQAQIQQMYFQMLAACMPAVIRVRLGQPERPEVIADEAEALAIAGMAKMGVRMKPRKEQEQSQANGEAHKE